LAQSRPSFPFAGNRYEVEPRLVGKRVEVRYDPYDLAEIEVTSDGRHWPDVRSEQDTQSPPSSRFQAELDPTHRPLYYLLLWMILTGLVAAARCARPAPRDNGADVSGGQRVVRAMDLFPTIEGTRWDYAGEAAPKASSTTPRGSGS